MFLLQNTRLQEGMETRSEHANNSSLIIHSWTQTRSLWLRPSACAVKLDPHMLYWS